MRLFNFLFGICCVSCFVACESNDLEIQSSQEANKMEKKSLNEFDYWYPSINITKYFSPYDLSPILDYIKNDDLAAVGVYITPNVEYAPPSYNDLQMFLKWNNGWSIMLGGSDEKELYLLYNIPTSKKNSYVKVDVPFNYLPGYTDSYITFYQNGHYRFSAAGGGKECIQVMLGVDKTDTSNGFKYTYVSSGIDEGYREAPCTIWTFDVSKASYVYPKR